MQDTAPKGPSAAAPFNATDWLRRLWELNPWATGAARAAGIAIPAQGTPLNLNADEVAALDEFLKTGEFAAARKAACLERWQAGKAEWNAWAEPMLALRREAEAAAAWRAKKEYSFSDLQGEDAAARAHLALAGADFSEHTFPGNADFNGTIFPGRAGFEKAIFGDKEKSPGAAWFEGAQFSGGGARFEGAQFAHGTFMSKVRISYDENLYRAGQITEFHHGADFTQAIFDGPVTLAEARFRGPAVFTSARSKVAFSLAGTRFERTPDFIEPTFHEPPRLDNVAIAEPLAKGPRKFAPAPDGVAADPRLRGRRRWHWLFRRFAVALDGSEHARFRKLRKMASEAKDHEQEARYNAHEIACRRFWVDAPWTNGLARFWFSWAYGVLSNYGLAVVRPFLGWLALLAVSTFAFLACAGAWGQPELVMVLAALAVLLLLALAGGWARRLGLLLLALWLIALGLEALTSDGTKPAAATHASPPATALPWLPVPRPKWLEAWQPQVAQAQEFVAALTPSHACTASYIEATREGGEKDGRKVKAGDSVQPTNAVAEAFVLAFRNALIFDRSDVSRRMYGCLYGILEKDGQDYPYIPGLVTLLSTLQSFLSAILIFLFGLGLRNMFRIK